MKAVRLRFDTGPRSLSEQLLGQEPGLVRWLGAATLVVVLVAGVVAGWQLASARQQLAATQEKLKAFGRRQPVAVQIAKPVLSLEERRAWNQVVRQLNTPWTALLAGLEAATPQDVALVSIEPDARQSSVRLQAEAKTLGVLLAYAQALKGTDPFVDVAPVKHETNEQDPNQPVRLTLNLRLREPRTSESAAAEAR